MKETQEILTKMGFININKNVWNSDIFGVFILHKDATPKRLAEFIYRRGGLDNKPLATPIITICDFPQDIYDKIIEKQDERYGDGLMDNLNNKGSYAKGAGDALEIIENYLVIKKG
jgi:hypothetical protein